MVLPYSSGTTGLPKGVMLTHHNLVANLCQTNGMQNFEAFGEQDVVLAALPYFHIYGMVVIMMLGLSNGATVVSHAALRLPGVPRHRAEVPAHRAAARAADRARDGEESGRQPVRPLERAARVLGRGAARRGPGARAQQAARVPGDAGLRHDRSEPGHAPEPHPQHHAQAGLRGPGRPEHGSEDRRPDDRGRGRRARQGRRAAHSRPADHEGVPQPSGGHGRRHRSRRLVSHGRRRIRRRGRLVLHRRSHQGAHQVQGHAGRAGGARGAAAHAPRRARRGRRPPRRRGGGRGAAGVRGAEAGRGVEGDESASPSWRGWRSAWRRTSAIRQLEFIDQIPKSASGKILRRLLVDRRQHERRPRDEASTASVQIRSSGSEDVRLRARRAAVAIRAT